MSSDSAEPPPLNPAEPLTPKDRLIILRRLACCCRDHNICTHTLFAACKGLRDIDRCKKTGAITFGFVWPETKLLGLPAAVQEVITRAQGVPYSAPEPVDEEKLLRTLMTACTNTPPQEPLFDMTSQLRNVYNAWRK